MQEELGFSDDDVRALILQGIRSSWLSDDRKASLEKEFVEDSSWEAVENISSGGGDPLSSSR